MTKIPASEREDPIKFSNLNNTPFDINLLRQDHNLTLRLKQRVENIGGTIVTAIIDRLHSIEATADDSSNLYKLQEGLVESIDNIETDSILASNMFDLRVKQTMNLGHLAKQTLLKGENFVTVGVCFDKIPKYKDFQKFGEVLQQKLKENPDLSHYDITYEARPNCIAYEVPYGGKEMHLIIKPCVAPDEVVKYEEIDEEMLEDHEMIISKNVVYDVCLEAAQTSWLNNELMTYPANGRAVKDFCLIWRDILETNL